MRAFALPLFALLALPLCVQASTLPNTSGRVYSGTGALTEQQASLARVVAIRPVKIQVQPNGRTSLYVGTAIGAATGYAVTRHSSGSFRGLGTIAGGAAGAAIGNGLSNRTRVHEGVQIFLQTKNAYGRPNPNLTSVVQDNDQNIRVGQDVLLILSRDGLSVAPVDVSAGVGADTYEHAPMSYASAFATDTSRAAQMVASVAQQIRLAHRGNYADLNPPQGTVMLPWGELVAFSGPYPDTRSFKRFGLHIDGVPRADCMAFVTAAAPRFDDVWMADAGPRAVGSSVFRHGHLDRSALDHVCHAHAAVGIDFISH
jgi:outer membrane lipoprotein SlyB